MWKSKPTATRHSITAAPPEDHAGSAPPWRRAALASGGPRPVSAPERPREGRRLPARDPGPSWVCGSSNRTAARVPARKAKPVEVGWRSLEAKKTFEPLGPRRN